MRSVDSLSHHRERGRRQRSTEPASTESTEPTASIPLPPSPSTQSTTFTASLPNSCLNVINSTLPPLTCMALQSRPSLFHFTLFPGIPGAVPPLLFPPGMFSNPQLPMFCSNAQPFQAGALLQPNLPDPPNRPLPNISDVPAVRQSIQVGSTASSSTVATSPATVGEGQQTTLNEFFWYRTESTDDEPEFFNVF